MMVERRKKIFNIISKRFLESIIDDVSSIYVGVIDNSIDIYSLKAEIKLGLLYAFKAADSKFKAYEIYSRIQACLISEEDSCILIKVNIDGDYPNSVKEYLLKYIQKCLYSLRVEYDGRISISALLHYHCEIMNDREVLFTYTPSGNNNYGCDSRMWAAALATYVKKCTPSNYRRVYKKVNNYMHTRVSKYNFMLRSGNISEETYEYKMNYLRWMVMFIDVISSDRCVPDYEKVENRMRGLKKIQ